MQFPLKWQSFGRLPSPRNRIRPIVSELDQSELRMSPVAIEILSEICGGFLRSAQRRTLAALLHEHLTDARIRSGDHESQTDVLGAIVGLAVFLLDTPGDWLLLRVPDSTSTSPDIFALQHGSAPWVIELEGTAPLSTHVEPCASLEACDHMLDRRRVGLRQLEHRGVRGDLLGGRALAVTTFPDAALTERHDITKNVRQGCPTGLSCADQCLRSQTRGFRTSIVSLLWRERNESVTANAANAALRRVLALAHALDLATWADARTHADAALEQMAAFAPQARGELGTELVDDILDRMIDVSAVTASTSVRERIASTTAETARTHAPQRRDRQRVPLEQALASSERDLDIDVEDGPFLGRGSTGRFELSASTELVEASANGSATLADETRALLEREAARLGGAIYPIEIGIGRPGSADARRTVIGLGLYAGRDLYGWASLEGRVLLAPRSGPPLVES